MFSKIAYCLQQTFHLDFLNVSFLFFLKKRHKNFFEFSCGMSGILKILVFCDVRFSMNRLIDKLSKSNLSVKLKGFRIYFLQADYYATNFNLDRVSN